MSKKVIIVGGGIGGLACAVRLLKAGYYVTVYEKEATLGGRLNQIQTEGFTFDLTAAILLLKQPLLELFEDLELSFEDYFDEVELNVLYRIFYQNQKYDVAADLSTFLNTIEQQSLQQARSFSNFIDEGNKRYTLTNELILSKPFENMTVFFNQRLLKATIKLNPLQNASSYLKQFSLSSWLEQYILFQTMYVGINPYKASNIYHILPAVTQLHGISYLRGGLYSIVQTLQQLITDVGGQIYLNTEVTQIITKYEKAVGIKTEHQTDRADIILVNEDVLTADETLLHRKRIYLQSSCSAFILHLGLNIKLSQLQVHNLFLGPYFKKNITAPFIGLLPKQPSLYVYCPSRIDSKMAINGGESLSVTIRVPHLSSNFKWTPAYEKQLRDYIIQTLAKILNEPHLSEHIVVESTVTPVTLKTRFNAYDGNAFGVNHSLLNMTYFRPHHKSKQYKNLYYVGASTHPGTGIALVLKGAKLVTEMILRDTQ